MKAGKKCKSCSTNQTDEKFLEDFEHKMAIGTDHFQLWGLAGGGDGGWGEGGSGREMLDIRRVRLKCDGTR
jgi:hypothetical protein